MVKIKWFPPSWVQITYNNELLYIDPSYLKKYYIHHPSRIEYSSWPDETDGLPEDLPKADVILITHEHKDHCKYVTINRLSHSRTVIYGPKKCGKVIDNGKLKIIKPGETFIAGSFIISAVFAYNTPGGSAKKKVHKKGTGLGYLISTD